MARELGLDVAEEGLLVETVRPWVWIRMLRGGAISSVTGPASWGTAGR